MGFTVVKIVRGRLLKTYKVEKAQSFGERFFQ